MSERHSIGDILIDGKGDGKREARRSIKQRQQRRKVTEAAKREARSSIIQGAEEVKAMN